MGGHTKIHFIYMFGLAMLYDCKVDEGFRHDMGHVIIGAVPAVADEDISGTRWRVEPVDHIAEGPEFILVVDGLDKRGRIGVLLDVIEGIQVHAVEAFRGMSF